jgi:DNA-binding transcriptional LysR family regulator
VVDELRAGALVAVLEEFAPAPIPVQLVHAGHRLAPAKLRAFLDWAAPRLRARLAAIEGIG